MFQRISNGLELAKASWRVLMLDKELLVFPLLSGIACLLVFASFALPMMSTGYIQTIAEKESAPEDPFAYVILFAFYFVNYFVIVFFNTALIACAIIRFRGDNPTLQDGLQAAMARLPQIVAWALVCATVGTILRLIESRSEKVGRFVAGLLGMAWSITTYFVVPVLVVEKAGPFEAIKRSLSVLRKTWGEALVSNFGIGIIVFLCGLASMLPALFGILSGNFTLMIVGIVATVLLVILVSLISSALNAIVVAALYEYAARNAAPRHFDEATLRHAFAPR